MTTAKRVSPDEALAENEKYHMRSWLIRIGLGGEKGKEVRRVVLQNLKGHVAFGNTAVAEKWYQTQRSRKQGTRWR